jgi:LPS O-antigen subunit length determinant protein (WzzB/FepE family)
MPWPPRRSSSHELQLQRECEVLRLRLLKMNSQLHSKTLYAQRLEYLAQRSERVDELNAKLEQSREQVRRLDLQNQILVEMIAAPPLDAIASQ